MSKSSKSARHNDDKNYQRKVMNAPQKVIFEENLKQLHDPRNYATASTTKSTHPAAERKFKSKLRSPAKTKPLHITTATNQVHLRATASKNIERRSFSSLQNPKQYNMMKVHQDSGESMIHQTKASRKEIKQSKPAKLDENTKKDEEIKMEASADSAQRSNTNGKTAENESQQTGIKENVIINVDKSANECVPNESCVQEESSKSNTIEVGNDQNNLNGHEGNEVIEEKLNEVSEPLVSNEVIMTENENMNKEPEELKEKRCQLIAPLVEEKQQTEIPQNDECTLGSDLVGSTTSESSPMKDTNNQTTKEDHKTPAKETDDVSFISYDSSIMLKDVKIKLNDCLKDNSKLLDVTDPNASMTENFKDVSFGRTLRSISGRNSLRRMKYVTVRENIMTPNDSLFVNMSSTSFSLEQSKCSQANNPDSPYIDTSRFCRKRKLDEEGNTSTKKSKTDDSYGFLNSSFEYLKNLRKPVRVSTPNVRGYKFNIDEKKSNDDNHSVVMEEITEPKKWCIIM